MLGIVLSVFLVPILYKTIKEYLIDRKVPIQDIVLVETFASFLKVSEYSYNENSNFRSFIFSGIQFNLYTDKYKKIDSLKHIRKLSISTLDNYDNQNIQLTKASKKLIRNAILKLKHNHDNKVSTDRAKIIMDIIDQLNK